MNKLIKRVLMYCAMHHGRCVFLWKLLCRPSGEEFAKYLRRFGKLYAIGEHCRILPGTRIADPQFVRIGNNVSLSTCAIVPHDGSIAVLGRAYNVKVDAVGKVDIRDNVFVGYNAIILRNVTIGPNAIVAAGAVVTKDVAEGDVVGGVPARPIGRVDEFVKRLVKETEQLPWSKLIAERDGPFDPRVEGELNRLRVSFFFCDE